MHLVHRKTCRVCGSRELTPVIDLGEQLLQSAFVKPGLPLPPQRRIPLRLVRCNPMLDERACGLLQLEHTVPPAILYSTYWYRSGTNRTMREHLASIAREATEIAGPHATVLDIGCNDGTLLRAYPESYERFGVDPSDVALAAGEAGVKVVRDVFPSVELDALLGGRTFDVITSIAMFYDLEDPVAFVRAIARSLSPRGLWVFEMSYMPTMLANTSYDTICHEHLEYYSFSVIDRILGMAGLKVVGANLNDINGGSIRVYATHVENFSIDLPEHRATARAIHLAEFDLELDTDKPYRHFQDRVNVQREELARLVRGWKRDGKRVHVYGASTKGNTILQWCGIDSRLVDVAAERNPEKFGASTLGTSIPIVSEEASRAMRPDYYLVLPWHFRSEILERERATIEAGTALVFPLPTIEIVRRS